MSKQDPYIGEVFGDLDHCMAGCRILILAVLPGSPHPDASEAAGGGHLYPAFRVEVIEPPAQPVAVGNKSSIGPRQVEKRYCR